MRMTIIALMAAAALANSAGAAAAADQQGKGMMGGMGMMGGQGMMGDHSMMEGMMQEGMQIHLDSILLMKDLAMTPDQKKRAEDLEKRFRAHMKQHDEMHKQMMGGKKGGAPMMNPCGKGH
ncbi:MAG: hypothetical protein HY804_04190 [Nitrospinae bacterium]|nr:hypothetical protein [Nitrospinota bacterium]